MTSRLSHSFMTCLALAMAGFLFAPLRGQDIPTELSAADAPAGSIWVDSLDLTKLVQGYGKAQAGLTVDNNKLILNGVTYPHGVGTHSIGRMIVNLHGAATKFQAVVGVDDDRKGLGSIQFFVIVDGHVAAKTDVMHGGDKAQLLTADLTGAHRLALYVGDADDGYTNDHADWAGALITLAPGATDKPETVASVPRMTILPPDPHPAIHGARIIGSTPGRFFLFSISATGTAPLSFAAENLPDGLALDSKTGIITGSLKQAGSTNVKLTVSGPGGEAHRVLTIVGGDRKLLLTPQMGWNSWNVWGNTVNEQKVKDAADEMIAAGLQSHGYQYVNIDQGWQPANDDPKRRDAQGNIGSNAVFPDMKGLSDYVHGKGLRIGLYSSPGPQTCGPYEGSYQHEDQDAQTYAAWGFDYLKYDWCTYGNIPHSSDSVATFELPYQKMRAALDKTNRDIVFSLCQYGMGDSWKWAADPSAGVMGNSWRTHGDIIDSWHEPGAKEGVVLCNGGVWDIINSEIGHGPYAGPGHWNDPDMLQVGIVGFGDTHPSRLTPDEQITHISMWCMLAAPLLIGCDMTRLDPFTTAILSNDEALDIDQDELGHEADLIYRDNHDKEVWARPLSDGTWAVALLNGGMDDAKITADWSDIGIKGEQKVRDLWLHKDVGSHDGEYSTMVPSHGTVLLKIGTPTQKD
jgi:alpha-galactosidase